jgi:hypothetical protein
MVYCDSLAAAPGGLGEEGVIQLSDGNGGLTFESNLTSTVKIHRVDHGASFITLEEL